MINYKLKIKNSCGISLLEILVVVSVFAVLGILITRSILTTLSGSRKSESVVKVRENLNYALGVMERQIRNAGSIVDCNNTMVDYLDQSGNPASFSCINTDPEADDYVINSGYVASGSARLTSADVEVTDCKFICTQTPGIPYSIGINLWAKDASASAEQNTLVTASTQVSLRNY